MHVREKLSALQKAYCPTWQCKKIKQSHNSLKSSYHHVFAYTKTINRKQQKQNSRIRTPVSKEQYFRIVCLHKSTIKHKYQTAKHFLIIGGSKNIFLWGKLIQLNSFKFIFKFIYYQGQAQTSSTATFWPKTPSLKNLFLIIQQNSAASPWNNISQLIAVNLSRHSEYYLLVYTVASHIRLHALRKTNYLGCGLSLAKHLRSNNAIAPWTSAALRALKAIPKLNLLSFANS